MTINHSQRLAFGLMAICSFGPAHADGTAKATVTIDGSTFIYSGGSCVHTAGGLVVNIGTLPSDWKYGTHPDYFGLSIEKVPGHFQNAVVTFNKNGKNYSITSAAGDATANGATFSGRLMMMPTIVSGSFSC